MARHSVAAPQANDDKELANDQLQHAGRSPRYGPESRLAGASANEQSSDAHLSVLKALGRLLEADMFQES